MDSPDKIQEHVDRFYMDNGTCCAGCDHWRYINSVVGECRASAPVSGAERCSMIGISGASLPNDAGHVLTTRSHRCGDFSDSFDWSSLPMNYQKRIGYAE